MVRFEKIHGAGNDFIMVESKPSLRLSKQKIVQICDRHFGIGADGIIVLKRRRKGRWKWKYYNSDGSVAEMCGNGIRTAGLYVIRRENLKEIEFETPVGIRRLEVVKNGKKEAYFRVNMGTACTIRNRQFSRKGAAGKDHYSFKVNFLGKKRDASFVSMGNPHCVVELPGIDLFRIDVNDILDFLRRYSSLFPEGVNLELVRVKNRHGIVQRTWERGVGETLACSSGACAVFWALNHMGKIGNESNIILKGGTLKAQLDDKNQILLEGPAKYVFSGKLYE